MADITMLSNTLSSLKSAGQLAKAILDLGVTMDTQVKIFDLQRVIIEAHGNALNAQTEQSALIQGSTRSETTGCGYGKLE